MKDLNESDFYQETRLPNGTLVISHSMPEAQSVSIGIFVDVGSRDEEDSQAGLTHALEHMVFKGTRNLSVHELAEKLDDLGGNANAFTSRERTCFHLHVLHESWRDALSLLTDMVLDPALPEAEWLREREVIYAEMGMVEDTPEEWVMDQHVSALFHGHSLGRPVLGYHKTLNALSADDLRGYLLKWYRPPRLLVTAAGRIEHQHLVEMLDNKMANQSWGAGSDAPARSAPAQGVSGLQELARKGEQAQLVASFPGITVDSNERPLAWLANQVLGGSMSSRLFREVREKRGLAYSVGSHLNMLSDAGSWSVTCGMEPDRGAECVDVMADVIEGFSESLSDEDVERAKRQLEVQFRMGLDSVEGQMLFLGGRLDEETLILPLQWVEKIREVDAGAVQQWAGKHLSQGALWTIAAPKGSLVSICEKIRDRVRPC